MKTIFAVTYDNRIRNSKFYSNRELARDELKLIAKDRRFKPGVHVTTDEPDKFSFLFGWEEHQVTFAIIEIPVI